MSIDLKPKQLIREQLDLEDWTFARCEAIAGQIGTGFAQDERGELIDGDAAVAMLRQNTSRAA
jgi:hypothetical protein